MVWDKLINDKNEITTATRGQAGVCTVYETFIAANTLFATGELNRGL